MPRLLAGNSRCRQPSNLTHALPLTAAGRAEVLGLLQRRRQPELLEAELLKRKLQVCGRGCWLATAQAWGWGLLLKPELL